MFDQGYITILALSYIEFISHLKNCKDEVTEFTNQLMDWIIEL